MTQSGPPSSEETKNISLKRLLRSKPAAEVKTSIGSIFLYPLRICDMTDFAKLKPANAVSQVREFLTNIGSLSQESDEAPERIPLDPEIAKGLSDDEIEQLAEDYVQSSEWQTVREGSEDREPVARKAGETASAYLIRLMKHEVEHQHRAAKRQYKKLLGSNRGLFDQVRKSSAELGSTVNAFEALSRSHFEIDKQLQEHSTRLADERAEELEMVRLTGQMTADSAKTLKDLADAATTLMEQFDDRDRKTDKSTRKQITIAVGSLGILAVLALLALIVSGFAYFQDRNINSSGAQWQAKLLSTIERGNQQRSAIELENEALREQVKSLDARIEDLEAAQRVGAQTSKATSTPHKDRRLGSTVPPP